VGGGTPSKANPQYWDGDIPWVSPKDMRAYVVSDSEDHITQIGLSNSPCQLVPPGALLMVVRSGILRNKLPVAVNSVPVALNQDMRAMIPYKDVSTRFVHYFIQGCERELLTRWCKEGSTVESVEHDLLAGTWLALPSPTEQQRIVDYLDDSTSKIDQLMALRRRQIELLREQRTAVIQRVVTHGLNPDAFFKDSGLPWLGNIPQHWEIKRNKFIFREVDVRSSDGSEELLTVSHITGVTPRSHKEDVNMFLAESNEGYKRVEMGDLAINTMWAWMGALGFSRYKGIVSPSYNVYRFRRAGYVDYYDLLFRSPQFIGEVIRHSTGIWESRLRLYPHAFFEIRSPIPPVEEQEAIVAYVERMTGKTEAIITSYSRQLELLTEYRAMMIREYVTGQRSASRTIPESMCLAAG